MVLRVPTEIFLGMNLKKKSRNHPDCFLGRHLIYPMKPNFFSGCLFKTKNRYQIKGASDLAYFFEENDQSEKCSDTNLPLTLSQHFLLIQHGQNFVVNT